MSFLSYDILKIFDNNTKILKESIRKNKIKIRVLKEKFFTGDTGKRWRISDSLV